MHRTDNYFFLCCFACFVFACGDEDTVSEEPFTPSRDLSESPMPDAAIIPASPNTGTGNSGNPDGTCPASPPVSPENVPCAQWQCDRADYPACWRCETVDSPDGMTCSTPSGAIGRCESGTCTGDSTTPDMGTTPVSPGTGAQNINSTGPNTVEVGSLELSLGQWELNMTQTINTYLPVGVNNAPTIILHHGFGLSAQDYASYGSYLASWGYVVIMPNTATNIFGGPTQRDMADILTALLGWLDASGTDSTHPLNGLVDTRGYLLAGHSLGGKLSFLVGTESNRVLGIFGIDPVDTAGGPGAMPSPTAPSVAPELMSRINVPMVIVGETTNATSGFGPACAPVEDNFEQYYAAASSPALKIEVLGASHMSFLDNPNCGFACFACPAGTDDPTNTRRLTQKYLTAFAFMVFGQQDWARDVLVGDAMLSDVGANLVTYELSGGF